MPLALRLESNQENSKRCALVIGINKYEYISCLRMATNDAEAISQVLEQYGKFEVERLPKRKDEDKDCYVVAEKPVTGKQLGQALRSFLLEDARGRDALIYFSGHGGTVYDNLGQATGYLITSDCEPNTIATRSISLISLNELIRQSELRSLVVILDCCHAGSILEGNLVKQTLSVFRSQTDYYLMAACSSDGVAYEGFDNIQHGVFTNSLLKGLSKDVAGIEGKVSVDKLFDFISNDIQKDPRVEEPIRMGSGRSLPLVQYQIEPIKQVVSEDCPYRGLEPFKKEHSQFFFGRRQLIQSLLQKLQLKESNFIPVIGASGSGKSSLVLAGLIPKLEKKVWVVLKPILPGDNPLTRLKESFSELLDQPEKKQNIFDLLEDSMDLQPIIDQLPGIGVERFLLVVDQFEEVFTVCSDEKDRKKFIQLLTQVSQVPNSRLSIVVTMRADFLEPCLKHELLYQLIQKHLILMPSLVGASLQQAIEEPAKLQGYQLESGLLGAILQNVGNNECLPLLEFALTQLWERRDQENHQLLLSQYEEIGGVTGALNSHAEKIYFELNKREQDWVKQIFISLVQTNFNAKDTRNRQPKSRLEMMAGEKPIDRQAFHKVLNKLIERRLLVGQDLAGEAWVELAHEALMTGWKRFADWLEEDRELRELRVRVEADLKYWQENSRTNQYLITGGFLARVQKHLSELKLLLPKEFLEFYQRSNAVEEAKRSEEERRKISLKERQTRILKTTVNFLQLVGVEISEVTSESEQHLVILACKGVLSSFIPIPVSTTVGTPSEQDVIDLLQYAENLNIKTANRVGILTYQEKPDALFQTQMFATRLKNHFIVIPIPIAAVEQALQDPESCPGLLADYAGRYLPGSDLFNDRNAIIGDALAFFGRTRELDELKEDLKRNQCIGLFGLRKSGKTSILFELRLSLRQHPIVYIDLQTYAGKVYYGYELFNQIIEQLCKIIANYQQGFISPFQIPLDNKPAPELASRFRSRFNILVETFRQTELNLPILCFIDEIERIFPSQEDAKERVEEFNAFFGTLRALSQETRQLTILVADVHPDCNRVNHWKQAHVATNPVCNFFKEFFLPPFSKEDTIKMIESIGQVMGRKFDQKTLECIHQQSGGHPFISRQIASFLCSKIPESTIEYSSSTQKYVSKPFSSVLVDYFNQNIWMDLEKRNFATAINIIRLLACNENQERIEQSRILSFLKNDFTEGQCNEALLWLEDVGLIFQENLDKTYYQVKSKLFSKWLQDNIRADDIERWKINNE